MIQAAKGAFPFPILCTDERIMSRNLCQDASKSPSDTPEPSEGGNGKASETSAYTGLYPSALSDISVSWRTFLPDSHEPGKLLPLFQADDRMYDFPVFKRLSNIQKHSSDEDNRLLSLFYRVFNRFQQRKQICRCLPKENRLFSFGIPQESFHRILIQKKGYILYKY